MPNDLMPPDPARFGLAQFADLLPTRDHILGEDPGSFDGFREALMQALAPLTPYEGVIAENLIAIEWELIQHRRMRDAGLRAVIRGTIRKAVLDQEYAVHKAALDIAREAHAETGGSEDARQPFTSFDQIGALDKGRALAAQAISLDPLEFAAACKEIETLGLNFVELMGEAYSSSRALVRHHDDKGQELERRRREVKRDFDALQKARPVVAEAEVIEG